MERITTTEVVCKASGLHLTAQGFPSAQAGAGWRDPVPIFGIREKTYRNISPNRFRLEPIHAIGPDIDVCSPPGHKIGNETPGRRTRHDAEMPVPEGVIDIAIPG